VVDNVDFMLDQVSGTFHGRDVFAPVAARLAMGCSPAEVGPEISDYVVPEYAKPTVKGRTLTGQVIHVDDFGNIITNISARDLNRIKVRKGDSLLVELGKKAVRLKYCSAYGDVHDKELLAVIGGHGFLEISVNQGSALRKLNAKSEMQIRIRQK